MKHILSLSAAALAFTFAACDNVDEKDRYIPLEFQETEKVVLAEEFTGAKCSNCPAGAQIIAGMHELYGDNFIPVSLYPEQLEELTRPYPRGDLRTAVATEIFAQYNKENMLPAAMFNRTSFDSKVLQTASTVWSTAVYNLFNNPEDKYAPCDITLLSSYDPKLDKKDPACRQLTVNYQVDFKHAVDQNVSFQIYILENGIVTRQLGSSGVIPSYENNHVLRTALNGTWGREYGGGHAAGSSIEGTSTVTLPEEWNADNIQVVGFLCNTGGDRQVLHAAMLKSIVPVATEE